MASSQDVSSSDPAYNASEASKDSGEPSLTSTLTILQRTQLLQLIAQVTAVQHQLLSNVFKADATLPPELRKDLGSVQSSKDNFDLNPNIDPGKADVAAFDEMREKLREREGELRKLDTVRLRQSVLSWFEDWRLEMMQRVGEIVRLRKEAKKQLEKHLTKDVLGEQVLEQRRRVNIEGYTSIDEKEVNQQLRRLYPPIATPLKDLQEDKRILVLHSMLLLLLSLKHYVAPSRVLLVHLCTSLNIPLEILDTDEAKTARGLIEGAKELSGREEAEKAAHETRSSNKWKIGLATAAGAAIIGITGGLAAPLVAAGVGSVMGGLGLGATAAAGYLGSLAGSTVLVGGLFGAYGGRMTGQMMDNYSKEVSDFAFLPMHDSPSAQRQARDEAKVRPKLTRQESEQHDEATGKSSSEARRLRISIGISGWLTNEEEVQRPWRVLGHNSEAFALRFDLESLMNLGHAMEAMVSNAAWGYAKKAVISRTLLAELVGAIAWPMSLAKISRVVDNPFTVAKNRADKAGQVLADALINRAQGERPVSLIGYSLGARVIYSCLQTLAQRHAFGLVESVVLIGAPAPSTSLQWRSIRATVSGRVVNVYSENDYVLGYLYRTSSVQYGVAGLQRIEGVYGIENIDVSDTISGHLRYKYLVGSILRQIGWEDLDDDGLKQEQAALVKMEKEAREKTLKTKGKEAGLMVAGFEKTGEKTADPDDEDGKGVGSNSEEQAQTMEKEIQDKTKMTLLQRGARYLSLGDIDGEKENASEGSKTNEANQKSTSKPKPKDSKGYASYLPDMPQVSMPSMPDIRNVNMPHVSVPNMPKMSAPNWSKWTSKDESSRNGKPA